MLFITDIILSRLNNHFKLLFMLTVAVIIEVLFCDILLFFIFCIIWLGKERYCSKIKNMQFIQETKGIQVNTFFFIETMNLTISVSWRVNYHFFILLLPINDELIFHLNYNLINAIVTIWLIWERVNWSIREIWWLKVCAMSIYYI